MVLPETVVDKRYSSVQRQKHVISQPRTPEQNVFELKRKDKGLIS